jgi:hypothetical protein
MSSVFSVRSVAILQFSHSGHKERGEITMSSVLSLRSVAILQNESLCRLRGSS